MVVGRVRGLVALPLPTGPGLASGEADPGSEEWASSGSLLGVAG